MSSFDFEETQVTRGAISRLWGTPAARGLWKRGLLLGLVGGFATLAISPFAAVPELLLWIVVAAPSPRFSGLAGAFVGHGAAWSLLLVTSSVSCASSCSYTLPYGPAHLQGEAWVTETRIWFAVAVVVLLVGVVLTVWAARRVRPGLRSS
jgi:hypothetical protein